jgi:A/G-specific adenine glycosylase
VNVARIVARLFGISPARGELRKNAQVLRYATWLVDGPHPRRLNWALLDLGALVCRPKPRCQACPLQQRCEYVRVSQRRMTRGSVRSGWAIPSSPTRPRPNRPVA